MIQRETRNAVLAGVAATWMLFGQQALALDSTLQKIQQTGTLAVGYRATAAPFSYTGSDGQAVGYAVDICRALVAQVQSHLKLPALKVTYVPVTAAERFEYITNGRIQMECADTTNSKPRRERVAFGLAYYYAAAQMMVRKDDTRDTLSKMRGQRVAVEKGSTGQTIVEQRKAAGVDLTVLPVANTIEGANAVAEGRADAFVTDDISLYDRAKALKGAVQVVGPRLSVEPLALMLPKNSPEFQNLLIDAMGEMYRSGVARQLYQKWFQGVMPGRGYSLDIAPSPLLNDVFRRPSAFVTDWIVF